MNASSSDDDGKANGKGVVLAALAPPLTAALSLSRKRAATMIERVRRSGLHDRLSEPADPWEGQPSRGEVMLSDALLADAREHMLMRNKTDSRFASALRVLEDFRISIPNRVLFKPMGGADELANAVHNEETLAMMAEFKLRQGSLQPGSLGKAVRSKTIAGYISCLRTEKSLGAGYRIAHGQAVNVTKHALLGVAHMEGHSAPRKLRRGLRAQHFREAHTRGFDISSLRAVRRWARMLVGHNFLLRGGEVGSVDERAWNQQEGMSLESVRFFSVEELAQEGRPAQYPAIRFMVYPIKNTHASLKPVPNWVRRRQLPSVPRGTDPVCAYDAFLAYWEQECQDVPRELWASTPLFRDDEGAGVRSKTVRLDCRAVAVAAGLSPAEFGASSLRIGGAEDIYDVFEEAADSVIKERGRWWTDIHLIYQRASASRHMRVSAAMGEARGISLEAFAEGWAMPGR